MKEISPEVRDRYYAEVSHQLKSVDFDPQPQEDGLLPVDWQGSRLCRLTARGGTQFREEYLERDGGHAAFDRVSDIAAVTAEYMRLMETAPPLKATGLEGDYRILADFNGVVLAGHPTKYGVEFITWEWDYPHTGKPEHCYYCLRRHRASGRPAGASGHAGAKRKHGRDGDEIVHKYTYLHY